MSLTSKEVQAIANLAHLELSKQEIESLQSELSEILNYIDQLQEVKDASSVVVSQHNSLHNIWREDRAIDWVEGEKQAALKQSPYYDKNLIKIKRVLK